MMNMGKPTRGGVQSVQRAFDILEALAGAEDGLGVTDVARALDLKTPTVHNLLRTLVRRGYAAKDGDTRRYRLGHCCAALGRAFGRGLRLPDLAEPRLRALSAELNESIVLGVLERGEVVFLANVEARRMLAVNFDHASVQDGYNTVCGRVLLAYLPPEALKAYVAAHPIAKSRAEDIRSRKDLAAVLDEVGRQGYCAYWRERDTVLAIAAPVFDAEGRAVAAVGVALPGSRFREPERGRIVDAVRRAADRISTDLGWPGTPARRSP